MCMARGCLMAVLGVSLLGAGCTIHGNFQARGPWTRDRAGHTGGPTGRRSTTPNTRRDGVFRRPSDGGRG